MNYEEFIDDQELQYFSGIELARYADRWRGDIKNELPPKSIWGNIVPTLEIADKARGILGSPIVVTSAYRSPNYNQRVGGASRSQHLMNGALDLIPRRSTPQNLYNILWQLRNDGHFMGGLGVYRSFVHVDTRGWNATW